MLCKIKLIIVYFNVLCAWSSLKIVSYILDKTFFMLLHCLAFVLNLLLLQYKITKVNYLNSLMPPKPPEFHLRKLNPTNNLKHFYLRKMQKWNEKSQYVSFHSSNLQHALLPIKGFRCHTRIILFNEHAPCSMSDFHCSLRVIILLILLLVFKSSDAKRMTKNTAKKSSSYLNNITLDRCINTMH